MYANRFQSIHVYILCKQTICITFHCGHHVNKIKQCPVYFAKDKLQWEITFLNNPTMAQLIYISGVVNTHKNAMNDDINNIIPNFIWGGSAPTLSL